MERILVLGDVHGCYYSFMQMVHEHWQPEQEYLILVGDLINKGLRSAECLSYWRSLRKQYPGRVILLRGNHEQWFLDHYQRDSKSALFKNFLEDLAKAEIEAHKVQRWLRECPLSWQNTELLITHAGISAAAQDPFHPQDPQGVLRNRKALRRLAQTQVIGHTIVKGHRPVFVPAEKAWYIDTGAWCQEYLSALRFAPERQVPELLRVPTDLRDRQPID